MPWPAGRRDVEPRRADPRGELRRQRQTGLGQRNALGHRLALLLLGLRPQPVRLDVLRGRGILLPEDMGMAMDQLLDDAARDIVEGERLIGVVLGDPGMEDDLEEDIAQLLAERLAVALLDGLDQLVRLLDAVLGEVAVRTDAAPGAGGADLVHDLDEVEQPGAGQVVGAGQQLQVRHGLAAGAGQPGQAVGQRALAVRRGQDDGRTGLRHAVVDQFAGGGGGRLHLDAGLPQIGQLRMVRVGAQHPVRPAQDLPGRP